MDEVLIRAGIFQGVEPNAAEVLAQALEPAEFPRGHVIFSEGEPGDRLYIIVSGQVKIGIRSSDGQENLLTIWASDMFGEMSVFDPGPRTSTATTITEVRAVSKDRDALRGHGSPIATKSPSSCCGSWPAGCAAPTATWTPLVVGAARVSFVRAAPGPGVIPPGGSGEGRATDVVHHPRRWPRTISFADGGHQRLVDVRGPSRQHGGRMRSPQTCSGDIDVVVARRHRSRLALPLRPVTSGPTTVAFLGGDLMNVPGRPGRSTRRP